MKASGDWYPPLITHTHTLSLSVSFCLLVDFIFSGKETWFSVHVVEWRDFFFSYLLQVGKNFKAQVAYLESRA